MSSRTSGSTNSNPSVMLALERLRHASLLADKRDMLAEIKRLLPGSRKDIASRGLDILIKLLKQQPRDNEIIQLILDILYDLLTSSPPPSTSSISPPSHTASTTSSTASTSNNSNQLSIRTSPKSEADITATALLSDVQNISTILDFVTNNILWLRLLSLKVLTALCRRSPIDFATCLVKTTIGMGRLVDCLDDIRAEIRDELLILLCMVTEKNNDVGTFFAFQDGYEKLFRIITTELQKYDEDENELLQNNENSTNYLSRAYIPSFDSLLLISNALEIIRNITQTITTQRLLASSSYGKNFVLILDLLFATFPPSLTEGISKTNDHNTSNNKNKNLNTSSVDMITNSASLVLDCTQLVFDIINLLVGGQELMQLTQNPSAATSLSTLSPLETIASTLEKIKEETTRSSLQRDIGAIPGLLDVLCGIGYGSAIGITLDDTLRTQAVSLLSAICVGHTRNLTQLSTILVQGSPFGSLYMPKKLSSRSNSKSKFDASILKDADKSTEAPFDLALTCVIYAGLYSDYIPFAFASRTLIHTYLLSNEVGRISFIAHAFAPPPIPLPNYMAATAVDNDGPIPHRVCVRYGGAIQRGGTVLSDVVATVVPPGKAILSAVTSAALVLGSSVGAPLGINSAIAELSALSTSGSILASALTPPNGSNDSSAQELLLRLTIDRLDMKGISHGSNSNNNETLFGILSKLFVTAISAEPETLSSSSSNQSATSNHPIYNITGNKTSPIPLPISIQLTIALLRILLATINYCPGAVNAFLTVPSNLAMVDVIAGNTSASNNPSIGTAAVPNATDSRLYTYGAGALLLASCFVNANEQTKVITKSKSGTQNAGTSTFTKTNLLQLLQTRIGINRLTTLSQNFLDSSIITSAIAKKPRLIVLREAPNKEGLLIMDKPYAEILVTTLSATSAAMMNVYSGGSVTTSENGTENANKESGDSQLVDASMLTHFKEIIRTQDQQLQQLRADLATLRSEYPDSDHLLSLSSTTKIPSNSSNDIVDNTKIEELQNIITDLQNKLQIKEMDIQEKNNIVENYQNELQQIRQDQEIERLSSKVELEKSKQAVNDLTNSYNEMNRAYYEKVEEVSKLTTELQTLQTTGTPNEVTSQNNSSANVSQLENTIMERDNTIQSLELQIYALQEQVQNLSNQLSTVTAASNSGSSEMMEEIKQNLEQWMAACTTRDEYIQQQVTVIEDLQKQIVDLQENAAKHAELNANQAAEQSQVSAQFTEIQETLTKQVQDKETELHTLQNTIDHERQQYTELQNQYKEYESHYTQLYNQYNQLQEQYTEMQNQYNQLQTQHTELQNHTEQQHHSNAAYYTEQITNLQNSLQTVEHNNHELQASLQSYQESYPMLEQQNQSLNNTVQELMNEKQLLIHQYEQNMQQIHTKYNDVLQSIKVQHTKIKAEKVSLSEEHEDLLVLLAIREEQTNLLEQALYQRGGHDEIKSIKEFSMKALEDMAQAAEEAGPDQNENDVDVDELIQSANSFASSIGTSASITNNIHVPEKVITSKPLSSPVKIPTRTAVKSVTSIPSPKLQPIAPTNTFTSSSFVPTVSTGEPNVSHSFTESVHNTPAVPPSTISAPWTSTITSGHIDNTSNVQNTENVNPFSNEMDTASNTFASSAIHNPIDPTQLVDIDLDPLSPPPSSVPSYEQGENNTGFTNVLGQMFGQVLGNNNNTDPSITRTENINYNQNNIYTSNDNSAAKFFGNNDYSTVQDNYNTNSNYNSSSYLDNNISNYSTEYNYNNDSSNTSQNQQGKGLFSFVAGMAKSVINQPAVAKLANTIKLSTGDTNTGGNTGTDYNNSSAASSMFQGSYSQNTFDTNYFQTDNNSQAPSAYSNSENTQSANQYAPWTSTIESNHTTTASNNDAPWSNSYPSSNSTMDSAYNNNVYENNPSMSNTYNNNTNQDKNNGVSSIIGSLRSSGIFSSIAGAFLGSEHDEQHTMPPYQQEQQNYSYDGNNQVSNTYDNTNMNTSNNPSSMFSGSSTNANDFFSNTNSGNELSSNSNNHNTPFWGSTITTEHTTNPPPIFGTQSQPPNTNPSSISSAPWSNTSYSSGNPVAVEQPPLFSNSNANVTNTTNAFMNPTTLSTSSSNKANGYSLSTISNTPVLSASTVSSTGGGIVWGGSIRSSKSRSNGSSANIPISNTGGFTDYSQVNNTSSFTAPVAPTTNMFNPSTQYNSTPSSSMVSQPPPTMFQPPSSSNVFNNGPPIPERRMSQTNVSFASPNTARKWFDQ